MSSTTFNGKGGTFLICLVTWHFQVLFLLLTFSEVTKGSAGGSGNQGVGSGSTGGGSGGTGGGSGGPGGGSGGTGGGSGGPSGGSGDPLLEFFCFSI